MEEPDGGRTFANTNSWRGSFAMSRRARRRSGPAFAGTDIGGYPCRLFEDGVVALPRHSFASAKKPAALRHRGLPPDDVSFWYLANHLGRRLRARSSSSLMAWPIASMMRRMATPGIGRPRPTRSQASTMADSPAHSSRLPGPVEPAAGGCPAVGGALSVRYLDVPPRRLYTPNHRDAVNVPSKLACLGQEPLMNPSATLAVSADLAAEWGPCVTALVDALLPFEGRVPLEQLASIVGNADVGPEDVAGFYIFDDRGYMRNLVYRNAQFEVLCLCWKSGQRSPIHDHRGSSCAFRVIEGVVTTTDFERVPAGFIKAVGSTELVSGGMDAREDEQIHQVSNLQPAGSHLVTLHVYSPPLTRMNVFSLDPNRPVSRQVFVFDGLDGDGI